MARATPPELVQEIAALTRQGKNQSQIATLLGIQQPRVSKIMKVHGIPLAVDPRFVKGSTKYYANDGVRTISVQIAKDGKPERTLMHASPAQLHALALFAAEMMQAPSPCPTERE